MPYDGEFASYRPLRRIAEADTVKNLLNDHRLKAGGLDCA
jgi:hypothetical protein